jgi:hypothetical protein
MISPRPYPARKVLATAAISAMLIVIQSCAPRPAYRMPIPTAGPARPQTPVPEAIPEPSRTPLPLESRIEEQDIKTTEPKRVPIAKETIRPEGVIPEPAQPPPLPDDSSLLAKLTPGTPPHRAASLRLTEEGRKLLEARDYAKALNRLEKTIVVDSTNPYGYFYLAKAHYGLARYKESLNFLDVAESRFAGEPFWLAEVHALRGENFQALGMRDKAEASYAQALRLNSGNRTATDAISRLQGDNHPAAR